MKEVVKILALCVTILSVIVVLGAIRMIEIREARAYELGLKDGYRECVVEERRTQDEPGIDDVSFPCDTDLDCTLKFGGDWWPPDNNNNNNNNKQEVR